MSRMVERSGRSSLPLHVDDHEATELMTVYYSTNLQHVAEISISVVSVSRPMANSSLQVLKIVKSGYVLFASSPPYSLRSVKRPREEEMKRGKRKEGKKVEEELTPRSGISKPVEFDPS
jgi:hypothetical protein